jgi:hypothetical protein
MAGCRSAHMRRGDDRCVPRDLPLRGDREVRHGQLDGQRHHRGTAHHHSGRRAVVGRLRLPAARRKIGMGAPRLYLAAAMILVIVEIVQVANRT